MRIIIKISNWIKSLFSKKSEDRLSEFTDLVIEDYLPINIEEGKLYYSNKYNIVKFLCPRLCGNETVLTIGEHVDIENKIWTIEIIEDRATIRNSVGSYNTCGAHYFIKQNKIEWLEDYY